jgi:hypothetical protein
MIDWITEQFKTLNVLTLIIMITFVTTMSRANTTKLLKEQSQEIYAEFEEIKDEIRGNSRARN